MIGSGEFLSFAAETLEVPLTSISLETMYGDIPQWDSMAHLRLVMGIASEYGVEIPFEDVVGVRSLWEFWRRINGWSVKKVIAVDMDNTLWNGVVGEDGVDAIVPEVEFQRELKRLQDRGTLLVALSKNNFEDVKWFFDDDAHCRSWPLSGRDFVAWRVNWSDKPGNLVSVADELNLGVDSFVFVDDNPVEREQMRTMLPDVTVVESPLQIGAYFSERTITAEDREKTAQYRAEAQRKRFAAQVSPDEYLRSLNIWTEVHELVDGEIPRVSQLSQKANQFNVWTHRYSESDVRNLRESGKHRVFTVHSGDRFGDQGLVAYVVVRVGEIAVVSDWVMSCRVMGRGVECEAERQIECILRKSGVKRLEAEWHRTPKNAPVENLFDRLGFELREYDGEVKKYERFL